VKTPQGAVISLENLGHIGLTCPFPQKAAERVELDGEPRTQHREQRACAFISGLVAVGGGDGDGDGDDDYEEEEEKPNVFIALGNSKAVFVLR
jgi:hypothetical protein